MTGAATTGAAITRTGRIWLALACAVVLTAGGVVWGQKASAATIQPGVWYQLTNRLSGKVLDVTGGSTADGADVVQYTDTDATNQQWRFVDAGGGYYRLLARHSGKALDVTGGSTADGADVVQWTDSGGQNQQWSVVDTTGGYVKLLNRRSAKALDVQDRSTADGGDVVQWTDNGGPNQQWLLTVVGTDPTAPPSGTWSVAQPGVGGTGCDGVRATLTRTAAGGLTLGATRNCAAALLPAPVGVVTTAADLGTGLTFTSRADRVLTYSYTTVSGKSRQRSRTATESRLVFSRGSATLTVVLRVSADGVAFRYELPGSGTITREASTFTVPGTAVSFLSGWQSQYENPYVRGTASAAASGDYVHPALFQAGANWVLLSESDVDGRYSGARLTHTAGTGQFGIRLADAQVAYTGGLATSWRTAVIGTAATVVESTLNEDVAPASKISDTSWIRTGVSAWSWLDGYDATQRNLTRQKEYVDYAASQGWEYVVVDDGWNVVTWMPELVSYAAARNVRIILWYRWTDLDTATERSNEFARIAGWGVAGVKLDFMESDSQSRYRWYDDVLAAAAQYHLVVDFHGSTIPHGIQRTWPNVLAMEAVRGEEYGSRAIGHVVALPFTRNAVGSMDYTAMTFQNTQPNSQAAELGLGVVFEAGLQVFGGSIAAYRSRPEAQRFLRQLPTVWDETRLVAGDPTAGPTIARRNGARWFVGGVYPGGTRTVSVPLTFLSSGSWLVETVTDGSGGLVRSSRTVTAGTALSVPVVANGGFAAQLCPATAGRTTCDE
ncbi:glycoside hydrolase family 97 catalytic domain-containing protein [Micromonospora sp. 067-2]|uniref:glycoside hydrolase family 97 catalytic domain-containing protein n=1 Tax=Micromonospora sp. 067-2 TaxID=2789270 RepID=UPI00397A2987